MTLVMEAFDESTTRKWHYEIVGHSGDGPNLQFVAYGEPPATAKQRLDVINKMKAHCEYSASGDHTLEATTEAIERVYAEEADDYIVMVISDANLPRYGIKPQQFGAALTSNMEVQAFAVFIASIGSAAESLKKGLPLGKSWVCLDTGELPTTFGQIFAAAATGRDWD